MQFCVAVSYTFVTSVDPVEVSNCHFSAILVNKVRMMGIENA